MNSQYDTLIFLAEELGTPLTPEKTQKLNVLLAELLPDDVKPEHLSLLDDLISTMSNTENLFSEHRAAILKLQDDVRSKIYSSSQ